MLRVFFCHFAYDFMGAFEIVIGVCDDFIIS